MNHTTEPEASDGRHRVPVERLQQDNPEVEQRVQGWFASGQPLVWIPILSQENFPDMPPEILHWLDSRQAAFHVPINAPVDLLRMPEGVTGWLMPADAVDTDVACGVWNGEVYILGVKDTRTGRQQTLLGERFDVATGQVDDPAKSTV
jgi:hypothetical protein